MSRRRVKPTGCGKFFIVMLIIVPVSFIAASLFTGQNPLDAINELFGREKTVEESMTSLSPDDKEKSLEEAQVDKQTEKQPNPVPVPKSDGDKDVQKLREDMAALERKQERLQSQIELLEKELDKCQARIQNLTN